MVSYILKKNSLINKPSNDITNGYFFTQTQMNQEWAPPQITRQLQLPGKKTKRVGMNDLAKIVLNLQRDIKKVTSLMSPQGAEAFVAKHNDKNPDQLWTLNKRNPNEPATLTNMSDINTEPTARQHYEELVTDKKEFQKQMKKMMTDVKNQIGFEVNICDDIEKQLAFIKVLEYLHKTQTGSIFPIVIAKEGGGKKMGGREKWFTISHEHKKLSSLIGHILGELSLLEDISDTNPVVMEDFQPDSFTIIFVDKSGRGKETKFDGKIRDSETGEVETEEFELSDDFRDSPSGSFFPFVNLSPVDLSCLQIFNKVEKDNYNDCCFVYACIQSGIFTEDEIQEMRQIIQTRSLTNNKIKKIAEYFKCNFVVKRIDEEFGSTMCSIDII